MTSCPAASNISTSCHVLGGVGWGGVISSCCDDVMSSCFQHFYVMLRLGWGGVGWGSNFLLRWRHVQQLPTCLRHATPVLISSKYVVRYKLFYCCLTYLPYVLPKKIRLYSDGAKAWESLCKEKRSIIFQLHIENNSSLESWKHGKKIQDEMLSKTQMRSG